MQCCLAATALMAVAGRVSAQTPSAPGAAIGGEPRSIQLNSENVRLNNYLHDLAGPGAFVSMIGGGVLDEIRKTKNGPDDLSGRIGTRALQRAVDVSVHHGLAALMHHSTDYQPCHCHGFGRKVGHALLESFTDRRDDGSRALAIPRFASSYASGFTALAWDHSRNAGDVLLGTTMSFGFSALFNVAKELTGLAR
jgi:hypothetical protein